MVPTVTHTPAVIDEVVPLVEPSPPSEPAVDKAIIETHETVEPFAAASASHEPDLAALDASTNGTAVADEHVPHEEHSIDPDTSLVSEESHYSEEGTPEETTLEAEETSHEQE